MVSVKIDNLIQHSVATLNNSTPESVQTNARKAIESFCKVMILEHFKNRGNEIICSKDEEWNKKLKIYKSNIRNGYELVLQKMLDVVINSEIIDDCYKNKDNIEANQLSNVVRANKEKLRSYMTYLKFSGNASSHESTIIVIDNDDVLITQTMLKKLLNWLFLEFFEHEIPAKLMPYIGTYDIFISYRHTDIEWVKILIDNLKAQGYSVFEENYQGGGGQNNKTFLRNAVRQSKVGIILYSSDKETEWLKRELSWMEERKEDDSNFLILPILLDSAANVMDKNIIYIDFLRQEYSVAFNELVCAVERVSPFGNCIKNEIVIPKQSSFSFMRNFYRKISYFNFGEKVMKYMLLGLILILLLIFVKSDSMINIGSHGKIDNSQNLIIIKEKNK